MFIILFGSGDNSLKQWCHRIDNGSMCQVIFDELWSVMLTRRWRTWWHKSHSAKWGKLNFCGLSNSESNYLIHYLAVVVRIIISSIFRFSMNGMAFEMKYVYLLECGINITLISCIQFPSAMPRLYNYTVCSVELVFRLLVIVSFWNFSVDRHFFTFP